MTTIATDGKSMAGDSLTTGGTLRVRYAPKVHRLADGRIIGSCGDSIECLKFERFMRDGGDQPALNDEWCGLILNPDGNIDWIDKNFVPVRYEAPFALGTGGELAHGAMLAGATPARAVEIACMIDVKSGGDIVVEAL